MYSKRHSWAKSAMRATDTMDERNWPLANRSLSFGSIALTQLSGSSLHWWWKTRHTSEPSMKRRGGGVNFNMDELSNMSYVPIWLFVGSVIKLLWSQNKLWITSVMLFDQTVSTKNYGMTTLSTSYCRNCIEVAWQ